eukprot:PhM_4_TR6941/c0_g1_i1/m.59297/K05665/ABCC1; ATP-binding cassette, subfamily C (CFTR/MRP), member 1
MEQQLLPPDDLTPEEQAGFMSRLTFWFLNDLLVTGYYEPLEAHHLPRIHRRFMAKNVGTRWENMWALERRNPRPSLVRAMIKCYIWRFQFSVAMELIELIFNFFGPILMQSMITYTSSAHRDPGEGMLFVTIMFISSVFRALSATQTGVVLAGIGMDVQTSMVTTIYNKAIRCNTRGKYTKGEIINIQSNDALKIANTAMSLNALWSTPANLIIALVLLLRTIGMASFAGMAVMLITIPFNSVVYYALASLRIELMQYTDKRVTLMNEMLHGIRVVKFTCLEEHFKNKITDVRRQELILLKRQAYWHSMASVVLIIIPIMVSVSTFIAYSALGYILTPAIIFTSVALFNNLRAPLSYIPIILASFAEAKASVRRVEKYLLIPELVADKDIDETMNDRVVIVKDAHFRWNEQGETVLKNINLEIKRGELVVVIGKVGSGKTSLVCAILGECEKMGGRLYTTGKIAYCQQQAWILNETVENNILFGNVKYKSEYDRTIKACALERDLTLLSAGDQTEIGEQGINLSGGQKQRLSLARAVYFNGDIYLLDDPLSAVDPHVGKHIFDHCIQGVLKDKTRILITHALQYLQYADRVLVMNDGQIEFNGTYRELMDSALNVSEFIKEAQGGDVDEEEDEEKEEKKEEGVLSDEAEAEALQTHYQAEEGKLIEQEERAIGAVTLETVWWYVEACGEILLFFFLFIAFSEFTRIATDVWLSFWSDQKFWPDPGVAFYLGIYIVMGFTSSLFSLLKGLALVEAAFHASVRLHNQMLCNVLRAPISFYDTTPAGRILTRFARDLDTVDAGIADQLAGVVGLVFVTFSTVGVIAMLQPAILLAFIPLSSVYYVIMQYYRNTSRELSRVVSVAASPIYSHFAESLNGVLTIRAYNLVEKFCDENYKNLDAFHGPYWSALNVGRWLSVRLEFVGGLVLFMTSMMVVLNTSLPPGLVGLILSYSMQITMVLESAVTSVAGIEMSMNSVERVQAYCRDIPLEAPLIIRDKRPSFDWMRTGANIEIFHMSLRYRPNLPDVLKDISCKIRSREKIGVVGRTGSGKSTFMLALMRMIELSGGQILIDGVDISTIGLVDLRSRISIIPQDPVLFGGTLRANLDPDAQHADKAIWMALEQAHLRDSVEATDDKLNVAVMEGGSNFSVGQRQLVCLARALLRNARLLLMDEVTANVDVETDALIQRTVAEAFVDCTVITIAHRLETITTYDKVMVMSDGRIVEYDTPVALLGRSQGYFRSMVNDTGERARQLEEMARRAAMAKLQQSDEIVAEEAAPPPADGNEGVPTNTNNDEDDNDAPQSGNE